MCSDISTIVSGLKQRCSRWQSISLCFLCYQASINVCSGELGGAASSEPLYSYEQTLLRLLTVGKVKLSVICSGGQRSTDPTIKHCTCTQPMWRAGHSLSTVHEELPRGAERTHMQAKVRVCFTWKACEKHGSLLGGKKYQTTHSVSA